MMIVQLIVLRLLAVKEYLAATPPVGLLTSAAANYVWPRIGAVARPVSPGHHEIMTQSQCYQEICVRI